MSEAMNRDGLLALYAYNAYANRLVLDTAEKLTADEFTRKSSPSHDSVRGILAHMLECEAYFLSLCQGLPILVEEAGLPNLPSIRRTWDELEQQQVDFLRALSDANLTRPVQMQIRGRQLVFPIWQMLTQAMIHSTHHRGELSIVLTELGYPLPTLDIIGHFIQQSGQEWPAA
ncbi:MAG: DinB family protein [Chloroflexi bacterium]|nr:DinB family protein [Chloroflexota bacterium]